MNQTENQPLFAEERQEQIVALLNKSTKLLVPELCEHFQVSPATIRSDLRELASKGRLKRTHGGAIPVRQTLFEPSTDDKKICNAEKKQAIAKLASELVEDGDTIAIDAGSTMMELSKMLVKKKNLTVVVNDLNIALFLEQNSNANIIVLGGNLRRRQQCTVGPITLSTLTSLNIDKVFLATNAFSPDKGFMTPDMNQAEVKKAMLKSAVEKIVLCDSSKIGKISFVKFAGLHEVDKLITDSQITPESRRYLEELQDSIQTVFA
ncbi:MAG: DeoR/GlpR transcriptional regulator [Lachnospiraceae bacterium]|jgi:DeoR family fructose operon transcriptional repressor|nr:DeoR/GlpR transcriptional regulator [Lachnospiraceae bacterium]